MPHFSPQNLRRSIISLLFFWVLLTEVLFFLYAIFPFRDQVIATKQQKFPEFSPEEVKNEALRMEQVSGSFTDVEDAFQQLARDKGGVFAFEALKLVNLRPGTDFHLLGHGVGDILYEQEGIEGMKFCTPDFRNACSHTIVVGAFLEFGEGAIPLVKDACSRAPGGKGAYGMCFHGLGHGVLAYVGYNMEKTVEICQKMGTQERNFVEFTECVGGAVMEIISGGGHDKTLWEEMRQVYLKTDHPLEPCNLSLIPPLAKPMCYTYLSPHLFLSAGANLANPQPIHYENSFEYCDQIPAEETNNRNACFGGIGKEFIALAKQRDIRNLETMTDEELGKIPTWCSLAKPEDGRKYCLRSAMRSLFWGGENDVVLPVRYCALMKNSDEQKDCFTVLKGLVRFYQTKQSEFSQFCAEAAERSEYRCSDL